MKSDYRVSKTNNMTPFKTRLLLLLSTWPSQIASIMKRVSFLYLLGALGFMVFNIMTLYQQQIVGVAEI